MAINMLECLAVKIKNNKLHYPFWTYLFRKKCMNVSYFFYFFFILDDIFLNLEDYFGENQFMQEKILLSSITDQQHDF